MGGCFVFCVAVFDLSERANDECDLVRGRAHNDARKLYSVIIAARMFSVQDAISGGPDDVVRIYSEDVRPADDRASGIYVVVVVGRGIVSVVVVVGGPAANVYGASMSNKVLLMSIRLSFSV